MRHFHIKAVVGVAMIVFGLVLPLRSSPTNAPAAADDRVQVIFAPQGDCEDALVKAIEAARKSLKIQMNDLASEQIARALAAARDRGVFVRVLLGVNASQVIAQSARPLVEKDHLVRVDTLNYSPFHVTIIVDDTLVITGVVQTMPITPVPVDQHVLLVKQAPEVTERYVRHWMERAEKSRLFHEVTLQGPPTGANSGATASPPTTTTPRPAASDSGAASSGTSDQSVYVTSSGKRYHTRECRYAQYGEPVSIQDAISRGMTPCKICKPDAQE